MANTKQDSIVASSSSVAGAYHVIIIGAGLSGIAAAVKLVKAGITDFIIIEKSDRVGGVWRENTYPGCCCDIPSSLYSYSFAPNPDWSNVYARQPEIQAYVEQVTHQFQLDRYIRFNTAMNEATWSEHEHEWSIDTSAGIYHGKVVIFAGGPLTEPSIPQVAGLDTFTGTMFHSARWDHNTDLRNKRVAVIGTGASAIQFIPEIQPLVEKMHVFQRTAPWVVPKLDAAFGSTTQQIMRNVPIIQQALRKSSTLMMDTMGMGVRHPKVMSAMTPLLKQILRLQIKDTALRQNVTPNFVLGCKRILFSSNYYPALARENVELIPYGITHIEGNRIFASNGHSCEVDVIIWGTGFDVSHPPIAKRIRTREGKILGDLWKASSPEAHLGCAIHGVPNAFQILGPNSLAYDSFIGIAEIQLDYVVEAIKFMQHAKVDVIEVKADAQSAYNTQVQTALQKTVFNAGGCVSYYLDEHGKNFATYPWSLGEMQRALATFDHQNYRVQ